VQSGHGPGPARVRREPLLLGVLVIGLALPILRLVGLVEWAWALVLAPFTLIGAVTALGVTAFFYRAPLAAIRARIWGPKGAPAASTPPPDHLDPPEAAHEAGEGILAEHPEILAALCHGFRMKKLMPSVLGQPVEDPWGVYQAALTASAAEFDSLRLLAAAHTAEMGNRRRKSGGPGSDAAAMRAALDAFRPCAAKAETGRGHPDCPFEHVTAVFGAESPNRDANLRSMAPKVRALLERQYPQLKTATLADGSQVQYAEWRKKASEDRAEAARLRKELERQEPALQRLRAQLADQRVRNDALEEAAERQRREAYETARAEQERVIADLRAAIDRAAREHAHDRQRHEAEAAKVAAANDVLAAERDALERALFASEGEADESEARPGVDLTGVRVLLVGGEPRQIAPLREHLESLGARLLHDDSVAAAEHVAHVHVVVFWIRYLSHPTYFGVRQKVRALRTPHGYWDRTSPGSLAALVARTLGEGRAPAGAADAAAPAP
jgi:hypothetical protein